MFLEFSFILLGVLSLLWERACSPHFADTIMHIQGGPAKVRPTYIFDGHI